MKKIVRNIMGSMGALNDATNNQKNSDENLNVGVHQNVNQNSLYSALLRGEKTEEVQNFVAWMNLINETVENRSTVVEKNGNIKSVHRNWVIPENEKSFMGDICSLNYKILNTKYKSSSLDDRELNVGKIKFKTNDLKYDKLLSDQVDRCNVKNYGNNKFIDLIFTHETFSHFCFKGFDFNNINEITFVSDRNDSGCGSLREFSYSDLSFDRIFNLDPYTTIVTLKSGLYIEDQSVSDSTMTETIKNKYSNELVKDVKTVTLNINS